MLAWIFLGLVTALSGQITYWATWDARSFVTSMHDPVVTDIHGNQTRVFKPGDPFTIARYQCFTRDDLNGGRIFTIWEDGLKFSEPDLPVRRLDIGCKTRLYLAHVPESLPPGQYTRKVQVEFYYNPIIGIRRTDLMPVVVTVVPK